MANRPYFISINSDKSLFKEESCEFEYFTGFSISQKQKSINSLHREILKKYPIENIFQSSKAFERGGPYKDLLYCSPIDAKKDERLKNSGSLVAFHFEDRCWALEPKTLFYDHIYIRALLENEELIDQIIQYNIFTDIEFNPKKSFNCQARSVAIFVSLHKAKLIKNYIDDMELFQTLYKNEPIAAQKQLTLM